MVQFDTCRAEIERLHGAFVEWYCHGSHGAFERVETALGPGFERVAPDGSVADREAVLEFVRKSRNTFEPGTFSIRIENVERVELREDRALVRYDECQETPDGTNGRRSTAAFGPRGDGVEWLYLQETWLDPPAEQS